MGGGGGDNGWGNILIIIHKYLIVNVFIIWNDSIFHPLVVWKDIVNGSARKIIAAVILIIEEIIEVGLNGFVIKISKN